MTSQNETRHLDVPNGAKMTSLNETQYTELPIGELEALLTMEEMEERLEMWECLQGCAVNAHG